MSSKEISPEVVAVWNEYHDDAKRYTAKLCRTGMTVTQRGGKKLDLSPIEGAERIEDYVSEALAESVQRLHRSLAYADDNDRTTLWAVKQSCKWALVKVILNRSSARKAERNALAGYHDYTERGLRIEKEQGLCSEEYALAVARTLSEESKARALVETMASMVNDHAPGVLSGRAADKLGIAKRTKELYCQQARTELRTLISKGTLDSEAWARSVAMSEHNKLDDCSLAELITQRRKEEYRAELAEWDKKSPAKKVQKVDRWKPVSRFSLHALGVKVVKKKTIINDDGETEVVKGKFRRLRGMIDRTHTRCVGTLKDLQVDVAVPYVFSLFYGERFHDKPKATNVAKAKPVVTFARLQWLTGPIHKVATAHTGAKQRQPKRATRRPSYLDPATVKVVTIDCHVPSTTSRD